MRRALVAAVGTVAGLAALLDYKSGPAPAAHLGSAAPTNRPTTAPSTSAPTTLVPTRPTTRSTTPSTTTTRSIAPRTVDGPIVENRYGPVQVEVTVSGGRLTDVRALQLPQDRERSARISEVAAPILRSEALAAQGAAI